MEPQRMAVADFMAITFAFLTFVLIAVDWAAASGRLRRNQWVGIRTPSTMRGDQAWVAGHRAALRSATSSDRVVVKPGVRMVLPRA